MTRSELITRLQALCSQMEAWDTKEGVHFDPNDVIYKEIVLLVSDAEAGPINE